MASMLDEMRKATIRLTGEDPGGYLVGADHVGRLRGEEIVGRLGNKEIVGRMRGEEIIGATWDITGVGSLTHYVEVIVYRPKTISIIDRNGKAVVIPGAVTLAKRSVQRVEISSRDRVIYTYSDEPRVRADCRSGGCVVQVVIYREDGTRERMLCTFVALYGGKITKAVAKRSMVSHVVGAFKELFTIEDEDSFTLGAAPPFAKPPVAPGQKPGGKPGTPAPPPSGKGKPAFKLSTAKVKPNPTVFQHKRVFKSASATAQGVLQKSANAIRAAKARTGVRGDDVVLGFEEILGLAVASANARKALTPKQRAGLQRKEAATAKAAGARVNLVKRGQAAKRSGAKVLAALVKQKKAIAAARGKAGLTRVHGEVVGDGGVYVGADWRGKPYDQVTAADIDQMTDDEVTAYEAWANPLSQGGDGAGNVPPVMPSAPPMSTYIADMDMVGGILYDFSKGKPAGFVGSYNFFEGLTTVKDGGSDAAKAASVLLSVFAAFAFLGGDTDVYGYVWGGGVGGGGDVPGDDPNQWVAIHGRRHRSNWWENMGGWEKTAEVQAKSISTSVPGTNVPFGPLVGNPSMQDFARLRIDGQGRAFWLPQEAPEWALFSVKQAAALTAAAEAKAKAEAAALEQAIREKTLAEEAEAQRAAEAAALLAETTEKADAAVKESQLKSGLAEFSLEDMKAQATLAQQQAQLDLQAQQLQLQAAQQQQQWVNQQGGGEAQTGSVYDNVNESGVPEPLPEETGETPPDLYDGGSGVEDPAFQGDA